MRTVHSAKKAKAKAAPAPRVDFTDVDMTDVYVKLRDRFNATSYGAFTSTAYDTAKRRASKLGQSKHAAKACGRVHYQKAIELWLKLSGT